MRKLVVVLLLLCGRSYLSAQQPVKPTNSSGKELIFAKGGVSYTSYLQVIATGGTTVTSSDTWVQLLFCTNTTSSSATLTVADTQGSPVTFWTAVPIAGNSVVLLHASAIGLYMKGIKLTAGTTTSISCQVQGVQ